MITQPVTTVSTRPGAAPAVRRGSLTPRCPLGLRDDHSCAFPNLRLFRGPAKPGRGGLQPATAQGMPATASRRCGRAPLVRRELSGRLHVLWVGALAAAHIADVQGPAGQARAPRQGLRRRGGVGPRRAGIDHDRLLDQHQSPARGARPASASALHLERHLLRTSAAGRTRDQIRGSAPGPFHGRAAEKIHGPARDPAVGNISGGRGTRHAFRKLAASRSGAEPRRSRARQRQLQLPLVTIAPNAPRPNGVNFHPMTTRSSDATMAVFLDLENIALGARDAKFPSFDIEKVLERLLLKGHIVVKKAYCDFDRYKDFKRGLHEAAFELIEIPHVRQSGKNSADIRMVVDALDLCYTKGHVDTFAILSGDSDFSPLVSKLRENAKTVIGIGVKNSTS